MLATSVCQLLATVAFASTSVLAWEKTHNWRYLDGYPLVIQPDRLIQVKGNVSYPGPPSEGPLVLTTTKDQIASCVVSCLSTQKRCSDAHPYFYSRSTMEPSTPAWTFTTSPAASTPQSCESPIVTRSTLWIPEIPCTTS